jgi:uncharacterized membrane protein (UPF0127 family)
MRLKPPALLCVLALACSGPGRVGDAADRGAGPAPSSARGQEPTPGGFQSLAGAALARVVFPEGRSFLAEVAATPEARARGLMFRERLGPQEGMVFLFEGADIYPFWMKNTLIPLDILWLDSDGRVVHLERSVPPCKADPCPTVSPLRPASWVLEVAAGQADRLQLGDRLAVGPEASPATPAPR